MWQRIKNIYHLSAAFLAVIYYRWPARRMTVIGISGTDGKTTTVNLIYYILQKAGHKSAMISTVKSEINGKKIAIGLHTTTPDSFKIQKILRLAVNEGCDYGVLEVTSHAIDQNRIFGCNFKIGAITNISHEHLDYHKNLKDYTRAKLKWLTKCKIKVNGLQYQKLKNDKYLNINAKLPGKFNVQNIAVAIDLARKLNISQKVIDNAIKTFPGIKGRMEIVVRMPFKVIVDFAHTPNAFSNVLQTVKSLYPQSKIIHVFGCTGSRDKSKRKIMGKISGRLADICLITHEDTYDEDRWRIMKMIEKGVMQAGKVLNKNYFMIDERKKAIETALKTAKYGDVVLITGVGHQKTLNIGAKEVSWSDQKIVKDIIISMF